MLKISQENVCIHFRLIEREIAALVQIRSLYSYSNLDRALTEHDLEVLYLSLTF